MNGDIGLSSIWIALAGGVVPALIAAFKRRAMNTLVSLRFRLHPGGLASARAANDPRASYLAARQTQTLSATAAEGRRTGPDRGEQRAVLPELDSRPTAQIAVGDQPATLGL